MYRGRDRRSSLKEDALSEQQTGAMLPWNQRAPVLFLTLCAVGFLGRLSYEMVRSPLVSLFAVHLGTPTQLVGLVVAAVTITGIFLKFPSGALADAFGFRRIMIWGMVVKATAPFIYIIVSSWPVLLVLRFYHGLSTALYAPAAAAFVAKAYPRERAGKLGVYSAWENAGVVLGPVVGAAVLAATTFSWTFVLSGLIGIAALMAIFVLRKDPPGAPLQPREIVANALSSAREVAGDAAIRVVSLVEGTMYAGVGTLQAYLPLYAVSVHLSIPQIGLLFGAQGVASIFGRPLWGKASDSTGRKPLIVLGVLLCAGTLAAIPFTASFVALLLLNLGFGLGNGMVTPSTTALIGDAVKRNNFGSAMGIFGSLWDTGHAAGPIAAGFLIAWIGYRYAFAIIATATVGTLILFLVSRAVRELSPISPSTRR